MDERYDPLVAEPAIQKFWEDEGIYSFDSEKKGDIYSVDTPPPTISGEMHIGHSFSYAQQDFIIRYKRMRGFNIFYPFGTDDNGLPTERLVEEIKNVKSKDMSRAKFAKLCLSTVQKELIPKYIDDWKRIGLSCDFGMSYSTINRHCQKISQWSFIDLFRKARVYRKDAPAMWCPECRTGISQVECEDKEISSSFNDIVFKVENQDLIVATTRPELLPACVAVFYNPSDERYRHLNGKMARVPLFGFDVPIMEDERADPEKGTGIVMCCTFGDQTDMEWQKAHNLPIKIALTQDGKMSEIAGKYKDMAIKEARKSIIKDLKEANLLLAQKPITHSVNVHERCKTEIEFIKSKQWFIKYLDLKEEMLDWGNQLKWYPEFMKARYDNWVKGLQWDWLISRQRHFGIPFPVWYCAKCGEVILADEKSLPVDPIKDKPLVEACPKCGSKRLIPEKDVLDTWATSSLTPTISCMLLPKKFWKRMYPMSLRPQAHDIITFWLFNTIVKSQLHYGKMPFEEVIISGFVTKKGKKMSKSAGGTVNPHDIMSKYGADAIRYWAATSKLGKDLEYDEKDIKTAVKFITKITNAARFVFMNIKYIDVKKIRKNVSLHETDRLFLSILNDVIRNSTAYFEEYNYSAAKREAEGFFWQVFCDNYLEIVKNRIYSGNEKERLSAVYGLYNSLLALAKIMAPITPYVTEEIWQTYFKKHEGDESVHLSSWPGEIQVDKRESDVEKIRELLDIVSSVRQEKAGKKMSLKEPIILTIEPERMEMLKDVMDDLKAVTKAEKVKKGEFNIEFVQKKEEE